MLTELPSVPTQPDAYRWLYADFAAGELSAVAIFLVGPLFSRRYVVSSARPTSHCAVNFALYKGSKRLVWVLSEYRGIDADRTRWRIGRSEIALDRDGVIRARIDANNLWGAPVRAELSLRPTIDPLRVMHLRHGTSHTWQALAPRANGRLVMDGAEHEGVGYADTNAGATKLGTDLQRWTWSRVHAPNVSEIRYSVEGGMQTLVRIRERTVEELPLDPPPLALSGWGLRVPKEIAFGDRCLGAGPIVESSPFYARRHNFADGVHAISESADLARFRSPFVRWMADWRTRYEGAAA